MGVAGWFDTLPVEVAKSVGQSERSSVCRLLAGDGNFAEANFAGARHPGSAEWGTGTEEITVDSTDGMILAVVVNARHGYLVSLGVPWNGHQKHQPSGAGILGRP